MRVPGGPRVALGFVAALVALLAVSAVWAADDGSSGEDRSTEAAGTEAAGTEALGTAPPAPAGTTAAGGTSPAAAVATSAAGDTAAATNSAVPATTTLAPLPPYDGWVNPASVGRPYSSTVSGMLTFRGNPTRSWYGLGPIPRSEPAVQWRFPPSGGLCSESSSRGETKVWCGTGWTGQANLWERADGTSWLLFGAYDAAYHFLDAASGQRVLPDLKTGDIDKGSATLDPDGFPLYYAGSRDNKMRIVALDRGTPEVLWSMNHDDVAPIMWNSDWDGAPLVLDDYMFFGGENSRFHIVKLNRGYGPDGLVTIAPELVFHTAGWDDELLRAIGDKEVSIESSVTIVGDVVYFANSGGLVQGWDISGLADGVDPQRVFRFWMGDDVDATITADNEGYLYIGAEVQRFTARTKELGGTFAKLDPRRPDDPLVWVWQGGTDVGAGIWSSAAVVGGAVITSTEDGRIVGIDRTTGAQLWQANVGHQAWTSPVVLDGVLLVGDCDGWLSAFDLPDPMRAPTLLWAKKFSGCLEATPTVWKGRIYLGSRDGGFYAVG